MPGVKPPCGSMGPGTTGSTDRWRSLRRLNFYEQRLAVVRFRLLSCERKQKPRMSPGRQPGAPSKGLASRRGESLKAAPVLVGGFGCCRCKVLGKASKAHRRRKSHQRKRLNRQPLSHRPVRELSRSNGRVLLLSGQTKFRTNCGSHSAVRSND
jgi:hypothetical protein